nr:MAG TPA: hypothetical protein [Caudoviricetes sp.]
MVKKIKCGKYLIFIAEQSEIDDFVFSQSSVDRLIESLEQSANDLYEQSVRQRELVERSLTNKPIMRIVRKN